MMTLRLMRLESWVMCPLRTNENAQTFLLLLSLTSFSSNAFLFENFMRSFLKGHNAAIQCVTIMMDSRRIISADQDGLLCVWLAESGALLQTIQGPYKSLTATNNMKFAVSKRFHYDSFSCQILILGIHPQYFFSSFVYY